MRLDQNPFFRKAIPPWYDSNILCWIFIIICTITFVFAIIGVKVALFSEPFANFLWLPSLMAFLSLFVVTKILIKLIKRRKNY